MVGAGSSDDDSDWTESAESNFGEDDSDSSLSV